jgi:predicted RND superfamily exporter protein
MEAILYTVVSIGLVVSILRRRLSDVLLVLAPLAIAALWTVAASAAAGLPFNYANIIVLPLLIGLGVASSIHIVVRTHEVVTDSTGTHEEGMHVLDTSTPLAVLVAQLNTVAAFATLAVANHRGLFSMGVLLGVSILLVLIVSLIVLPSFMIAIGIGTAPPAAERGNRGG